MWEKRLRLASGLVLATYLIPHLLNLSLGLVSLSAMEEMRLALKAIWHLPLFTFLLYGALASHLVLALYALYRRTTLKMPLWEGLQLGLGLAIVPLLLPHLIDTRGREALLAHDVSYEFYLSKLWNMPGQWEQQLILLSIVWIHLAVGLYYWLRTLGGAKAWLHSIKTTLMLIPVFAMLGYLHAGRHLGEQSTATASAPITQFSSEVETLSAWEPSMQGLFISMLLCICVLRLLRAWYRGRKGTVLIRHASAGTVKAQKGQPVLEALREAGIAHSSVCGGRGRCTTCQVRVTKGLDNLPALTAAERLALAGIHAPPDVRLACQLRACDDMSITPLVPAKMGLEYLRQPAGGVNGQELAVAALVVDLRGSTRLGEQRLPYDVVFILNQFFAEMAAALEETGGHYAQFNGDGLMALYGLERGVEDGCRQAVMGAAAMLKRLQQINRRLEQELNAPLSVGIGIHAGPAIVGTMGPPSSPIISAIGDTINIAARLEAQTKLQGCTLLISRAATEYAQLPLEHLPVLTLRLKGKKRPLEAIAVCDPTEISQLTACYV